MNDMYFQARRAPRAVDAALARDVRDGLGATQKTLPSKWFYDDEGSRLFQRIMTLPEYYMTRTEHGILKHKADRLADWIAPDGRALDLIELGSGDGEKTLSLCETLLRREIACTYHPIDVSQHALSELAARFSGALPALDVRPILGDYFDDWPATSPLRRQVALLLGGNLGNLTFDQSVALLDRIRARLAQGDVLLLGLDLKKDPAMILAAYDDAQGVTAAFNLNLLRRLNRELDMDFDLAQFAHFPTYSPLDGAARSFLVSRRRQTVRSSVLGCAFAFQKGETIYTEQSQKYSFDMIVQLAAASGFAVASHVTDDLGWYTVAVLQAIEQRR
ncbi:L-histidine N(alpha)-methyltransferase [Pseudoduganella chitinolytica]|uniref:L-histidine N(Alpha)-methyltransferase n=1 Tax=Pseudoduganella chitinolytica TaxID=34070 RepID=A0ABY8B6J5_9BURK|nr:L-histidine N(alpha)-methyltransferase [Pseudoduganella chitinolytica]WEF31557.1 L-histidine N(alpha)-methyltransferase [Pseudoduganella chitinolytica]